MRHGIVLLISCIIALAGAEIAVRTFTPQAVYVQNSMAESCYTSDPVLYTKLKPNAHCHSSSKTNPAAVSINSLGLRDTKDRQKQKSASVSRVLFIGDSYTFGHGVENHEVFPAHMEALLQQRGKKVEILNAGIPGVGLDWYYLFLKHKAFELNPDLIVVTLYLGNDLFDHSYFDTTTRDGNGLPIILGTSHEYVNSDGTRRVSNTPWQYTIPFLRRSHLFILFTSLFSHPVKDTEYEPAFNGSGCMLRPECTSIDADIQTTANVLREMNALAKAHNISLSVALIPWEAQLPRTLNERSNGYLIPATKAQRHAITDKIGRILDTAGIAYIDLLEAFEIYDGDEAVYTQGDYHWNKTGHSIVANFLAPKLESILFSDEAPQASETGTRR